MAVSLLAVGLCVHHLVALAADWPMSRGNPALTGVASGSLPNQPKLLWKFKTGEAIKSSAAIVAGKVYCGSDDSHVYALTLADGKMVWKFKAGDAVESSPLVLDGKVFCGANDGLLHALDAITGAVVWKYETGDKIVGGANYYPNGQSTALLAGSYDFKLHSLDAATGRTNWVYETGNYINGSPAVAADLTVFGGCDAILHVLSLKDGTKLKEVEAGAYIAASVALFEGRAYFGHYQNQFLCVDLDQGKQAWSYQQREFPYFSSPAVTKTHTVFGGRDKRLHCVKTSDGTPIWQFATRGKVDSSPVICGDKVVVGSDDGRLYIVNLETGKEVWQYEIGQPIAASPAVVNGRIVIGADDGFLYCFGGK